MNLGWWHCGLPLQRLCMCIGLLDVVLGGISTTLFAYYVNEVYNPSYFNSKSYLNTGTEYDILYPFELAVATVVGSAVQTLMGIPLFFAATKRSRSICLFWMVITSITTIVMWSFLIRIYEVFIVSMFYRELKSELQVADFVEDPSPPDYKTPPYLAQPPAALINQYPPHPRLRPLVQAVIPRMINVERGGEDVNANEDVKVSEEGQPLPKPPIVEEDMANQPGVPVKET